MIDGEFSNPSLMDAGGNFFMLSYEHDNESHDKAIVLTAVTRLFGLNINTSDAPEAVPDLNYTLTVAAERES